MAVEPIGSVMTYQAQQIIPEVSNTQKNNTSTAAYTEGTAQDEAASQAVDNKIVVVDSANKAEDGSTGDNGKNEKNETASNEQIKKAVEELNKKMMQRSEALFGIHEDTNRLTIKIVDQKSKEVLKEYPPEKTLDMIAKVWEMAGIIVDEKG
ncbi:MAG: flagellar protein FlaG [Lachnospiraceae bacterium]|nr:flagellar protein FlaG [Lachnospiraceae bacterium]